MEKSLNKQQVDFEKVRKKRQRAQTRKRMLAFGVIVGIVIGIVRINNFFIDTAFIVRLGDMAASFGGEGFPSPIPSGSIRNICAVGNNLVILGDQNLYIYNSRGRIVSHMQQMTQSTMISTGEDRVLTYTVGTRRFSVDTPSRNLIDREAEYSILTGDMNDRGDFVLATSATQYLALVTVYDRSGQRIFGWASAENPVAGVALSPRGDRLAVAGVNTQGGVIRTILFIFDIPGQAEITRLDIASEMPLDLTFTDMDSIALLTDRAYRIFSSGGDERQRHDIEGNITALERRAGEFLMLTYNPESNSEQLVLLSDSLREIARKNPQERVRDMTFGDRFIYILTDSGIITLDRALTEREEYYLRGVFAIHAVGNRLYYFTPEEIRVMR